MKTNDTQNFELFDENGKLRQVVIPDSQFDDSKSQKRDSIAEAAKRGAQDLFGFKEVYTEGGNSKSIVLTLSDSKNMIDTTIVEFQQSCQGIPLLNKGISIAVDNETKSIVGGYNNYDYDFKKVKIDTSLLAEHAKSFDVEKLSDVIALSKNIKRVKSAAKEFKISTSPKVTIDKTSPAIYRYSAHERQHSHDSHGFSKGDLIGRLMKLTLPKVHSSIEEDGYYAVNLIEFTGVVGKITMSWRALVEPKTNSLLAITPLVELQQGYVFLQDPYTATGNNLITPGSSAADLNTIRSGRSFEVIGAPPTQLEGDFVRIVNTLPPNIAPPTSGTGTWDYPATTDDFTAVNAYYHNDMVFRLVQDMGFDMSVYFDGTSFPVAVDHRGCCGCVNAAAWQSGAGLGSFTYGLVQAAQPVGIATDVRVVFHEFGHAILFDHVNSGSFGFAHSCGDSMAAIYSDPCSNATDRFLTFPWITLNNTGFDRRHDRLISAGWAWNGPQDDNGYGSEQILATSLFRAYRSLGGDDAALCERQFASRYMLYLILKSVGLLTPATNPNTPEAYVGFLRMADLSTSQFEGQPGGLVHKVVRWAFAQQGAFGAPAPNYNIGLPPTIDTFIDDGREGTYEYTTDWCHSKSIWNRLKDDGAGEHQPPVAGQVNYLYVVVENRGTNTSEKGKVSAFHLDEGSKCCAKRPCGDLIWEDDFRPTETQTLAHDQIASGSYTIVGPFKWIPKEDDVVLVTVDTKGDRSNVHNIDPTHEVAIKHLVPFDNNIAVRAMCNVEA